MATKQLHRFAALLAGGSLGGLLFAAYSTAPARADKVTSVGLFGGYHFDSTRNELGVPEESHPTEARYVGNSPIIGARFGLLFTNWVGVELEAGFLPAKSKSENPDLDGVGANSIAYRAHLFVELWQDPKAKTIPFLVVGGGFRTVMGSKDESVISNDTDEEAHLGLGVKFKTDSGLGVRIDARAVFPPSSETIFATMDLEATIGIFKEFGKRTRKVAEVEPEPTPVIGDADGDGIKDPDDQCKDDPEDADGYQDEDGCPDPDNDSDGIADTSDECKMDPEDVDAYSDEDGCPDPDNDGDGILDKQDGCPDQAEDIDQFQDDDGCPDPDNDGDGVLDPQDQCPDQMETMNGYKDDDGCADDIPKAVKQFTGVIKGINFKNDSDEILKSSFKTLDAAVKVLTDYPDLRLEVDGHTDDTGDRDHNMDLSQRRAQAVVNYFVGKGVDAARLEAHGFGPDKPLINKKTKAARAKNRRVEFQLIMGNAATPPAPEGGNE
jgi:OOP family OmpA-OmpF porin